MQAAGIDPERYNQRQTNQPQTSNNHPPSQRLSFAKNPHNGYSSDIQHHLGDLSYSDSSWAHTEIPLPRSETTSIRSYGGGGSAYSRVTDSYGNHTALLKPYSTSSANITGSGFVVRKETITTTSRSVTPNPYGSSQSSAFGGVSWGSSSNSQGSFGGGSGSGNQQNNHNEPPIDDRPDDYPDNRPDDNDSPTHQQQDYPCWIFGNSGCQASQALACHVAGYSFGKGNCVEHDENYKPIYLGKPTLRNANDDDDDNQGDDNQGDDNQKQDNQGDDNQGDDEKKDNPFDVNKAELIAEIGNLVNDGVLSLATRNLLFAKSDDAAIRAAIASGDTDIIATALNISEAEAEAVKLAAQRVSKAKAENAAAKNADNLAKGMGQNQRGSVGFADNAAGVAGKGKITPWDTLKPTKTTTASGENLVYKSNGKHVSGQPGYNRKAGTEPNNSFEIFNQSRQSSGKARYQKRESATME